MKKVELGAGNSLQLDQVPTAQPGGSWPGLLRERLQALFTCFSRFLSSSSSFEAAADLPRHLLVMPICIENTQHSMHDVTHLLQQLLFLFIINVVSLCSITFPSSVYLDCNGQQRIATILLTCLINFSSLSPTNVAGLHLLSSSATFIK